MSRDWWTATKEAISDAVDEFCGVPKLSEFDLLTLELVKLQQIKAKRQLEQQIADLKRELGSDQ